MLGRYFSVQPLSWLLPVILDNPLFIACHNPINLLTGLLLLHRIREDDTSERRGCFFFSGQLMRHSGEGDGNPLQYSCLENPRDGGAWWPTVHRAAKSQTRLSDLTHLSSLFTFRICLKCNHGRIDVEFLSIFPCSFKKISFNILSVGHCQLAVSGH